MVPVSDEANKEMKIAGLLPKFEQHVNQLISEYKGATVVRRIQHAQTRSNVRARAPFVFRRTVRRPRGWWSR